MVVASLDASNYYCICCEKHFSMKKKHIEEHNNNSSHPQFPTLQKNTMLKCFHIDNQCLKLVDFMLGFYSYLKVLMFFNGKYNGVVRFITCCAPFLMWHFIIASRTLWCMLLVRNMFKTNKHSFCSHFFKVHVSIWIFFLDVNWKHKSNLFEITFKWFKFAYVCI